MTPFEKINIVVVVTNEDDWSGFYINGKLKFEGHDIPISELLSAINGKSVASTDTRICDSGWLYDRGNLPDDLERVKWPR